MSALCTVKGCAKASALAMTDSRRERPHLLVRGSTDLASPRKASRRSGIRWGKVAAVRGALADGTYDLNGRLDAAVEKLFQALTT